MNVNAAFFKQDKPVIRIVPAESGRFDMHISCQLVNAVHVFGLDQDDLKNVKAQIDKALNYETNS